MADREYDEIREAADVDRVTVSEWVRRSLREARHSGPHEREVGRAAVRERTPPYGDLLERVMQRYGLPDADSAVRFALRRAADPPLSRDEILNMEGTGWEGDLFRLRSSERPETLP